MKYLEDVLSHPSILFVYISVWYYLSEKLADIHI